MNNTLLFTYNTNIPVRLLTVNMKNCLTPRSSKNQKMCDPILVTLLKMSPHESQSSRENATTSSGTCPLASYKEVPYTPPPPPVVMIVAFGIRNTAQGIPQSHQRLESGSQFQYYSVSLNTLLICLSFSLFKISTSVHPTFIGVI